MIFVLDTKLFMYMHVVCDLQRGFQDGSRNRHASERVEVLMTEIDFKEVAGCTCLALRRASRRATQLYDNALALCGVTVTQFEILARLAAPLSPSRELSIGLLADALGTDPTTLNRNLKPLKAKGLVKDLSDPSDARVRLVRITEKGERQLAKAFPEWHRIHGRVEKALSRKGRLALNEQLDSFLAKVGTLA
jgi:DNA-binding MarR family transcriptional regulator